MAAYTAVPMDERPAPYTPETAARVEAARARLAQDASGAYNPARHQLSQTVHYCSIHANNWAGPRGWFERAAERFSGQNMHCELWGGDNTGGSASAMGLLALSSRRGEPIARETGSALNPANWPRKFADWWAPKYGSDHGTFLMERTFNKMRMYNYATLQVTPAEIDQILVHAADRAGLGFASGAMYRAEIPLLAKRTASKPVRERTYFCSELVADVLQTALDERGRPVIERLVQAGDPIATRNPGAISPTALTQALLADGAALRGVRIGVNPISGQAEIAHAVGVYYGVPAPASVAPASSAPVVGPWSRVVNV